MAHAHADDRLMIEVVPVLVLSQTILTVDENDGIDMLNRDITPQMTEMFVSTRKAMYALGVRPIDYDLRISDHVHVLICTEATVYSSQECSMAQGPQLVPVTDLPNFAYNHHDGQHPPRGTVQLNVLLIENEVAWSGVLGLAWRWWWGQQSDHHWSNATCRAWALHSVPVIAHELGHCFFLDHHEDDTDTELDLMISHYAHYNWVKPSNKRIVEKHIAEPTSLAPAGNTQPMVELIY